MATSQMGLGKGLDALIRQTSEVGPALVPEQKVLITDLVPNPQQPRRRFSEKSLEELASSIRSQGLLQPLLVRPLRGSPGKYEIVAGERRWRASQRAELREVPVVIRNFSDLETLAAALIENLQREDLKPLEEAQAIQRLKEEFGLSQEDLAARLGRSRSAIANSLRLLSLPEEIRRDVDEGRLTPGHARTLLSVSNERAQAYLRNLILEESLSVREAEGLAATWKETGRFLTGQSLRQARAAGGPEAGADLAPCANFGQAEEEAWLSPPRSERAAPREGRNRAQSARLLDIQARIHALFHLPVRVIGKEDKGRISFTYNTREDLEAFLAALEPLSAIQGLEVEDAGAQETPAPEPAAPSEPKPAGDAP
ncbi:MAG: ParB/RepB/Spo0J family partition protein [Deltaproteobacteria bacterium]|jgi:ParB family chromosome partitioning protein|nr:ParB/RepB/Spo0J family partition protein [Deltaproteobacteria bacterium]